MNTSPGVPNAGKYGGGCNNGSLRHLVRMAKTIRAFIARNSSPLTIMTFSALKGVTRCLRNVHTLATVAQTSEDKELARGELHKIFDLHHRLLDGFSQLDLSHEFLGTEDISIFQQNFLTELERGHEEIRKLQGEADAVLGQILTHGDRKGRRKARLESMGERLATLGSVLPFLRSLPEFSDTVLHLPAFNFMRASVEGGQKFTEPVILWRDSVNNLRKELTQIMDNAGRTLDIPIPHRPLLIVTEGFIAVTPNEEIVTLGENNSDRTNGAVAYGSFQWHYEQLGVGKPAGARPVSTLFKSLDPAHLAPPPMNYAELRAMQRNLRSHMVSPHAIDDAENYGMCIDVYDIEKGTVIRFENSVVETVAK